MRVSDHMKRGGFIDHIKSSFLDGSVFDVVLMIAAELQGSGIVMRTEGTHKMGIGGETTAETDIGYGHTGINQQSAGMAQAKLDQILFE